MALLLRKMNYREYKPADALAPYIKCIWMLDSTMPGGRERILPDGCIELIFNYGDSYTQHVGDAEQRQPSSFIHGQLEHFIEISPSGVTGIVGVRFHPCGLAAFLAAPMHEFTQSVVATYDAFGVAAREAEQRLLEASGDEERLTAMNRFLLKQLRVRSRIDALAAAAERVRACNGNVPVREIAMYACMSERQLERGFREMVGLSPKVYARIARLQYVLRMANVRPTESISQLAYGAGYYDPAHFVRDFRELSGVTPAAFFTSGHNMSDLFIST